MEVTYTKNAMLIFLQSDKLVTSFVCLSVFLLTLSNVFKSLSSLTNGAVGASMQEGVKCITVKFSLHSVITIYDNIMLCVVSEMANN